MEWVPSNDRNPHTHLSHEVSQYCLEEVWLLVCQSEFSMAFVAGKELFAQFFGLLYCNGCLCLTQIFQQFKPP